MNNSMDALEQTILRNIQGGLPLTRTPYQDLSLAAGIDVNQLLDVLRRWKQENKIRRHGAIVNHFKMGRGSGAMVVWQVPADRADQVGGLFASFPAVSHAYLRPMCPQWPYNLYTMVHAADATELETTIEAMRDKSGIDVFCKLKTVRELKKVAPTYIIE
jgi:siroheme decarboxylase